jgi:hypothetical protein
MSQSSSSGGSRRGASIHARAAASWGPHGALKAPSLGCGWGAAAKDGWEPADPGSPLSPPPRCSRRLPGVAGQVRGSSSPTGGMGGNALARTERQPKATRRRRLRRKPGRTGGTPAARTAVEHGAKDVGKRSGRPSPAQRAGGDTAPLQSHASGASPDTPVRGCAA